MNKLFTALVVSGFVLFLPSCASVGAVIEGGKAFTTGVIDGSVNAVSTVSVAVLSDASSIVSTAATVASNTVTTVAEEVDKQTDELQDTPSKKE
jgi:hypothetical protein|tara:strand:+ start:224 stop:505 length:282 start_codon:yes stop_codon:yes gene_type:complete